MKHNAETSFTLDNFEGPLEFLLHLIQKNEIDIYDIPLRQITEQFVKNNQEQSYEIDSGAEFIATAATLHWLKSKMLLPKHEQSLDPEELEEDPRFEIIHHLIDYCRFKQAAKSLSDLESQQSGYYARGIGDIPEIKKNLGIEHLTLDDLAALFKDIVAKSSSQRGQVHEEAWKVSDKIKFLRQILRDEQKIGFELLFVSGKSRVELIVTFLAVLEMMKLGEACVIKENSSGKIVVVSPAALEKLNP